MGLSAPVPVAGALALQGQVRGASFAAHLASALGFPVAVLDRDLPDSKVLDYLERENAPELRATRVAVFCFPEDAWAREAWMK